ncbi:alpha/beta hydrolase family protein [Chloroflexota bacterium]
MNRDKVELKVDGLKIVGEVFSPSSDGPHPALMLCHGIPSGNPKNPDDGGYPLLAERFVAEGFIVMIFNFRGAGLSEGHFDILGWTRDLNAALDYFCDYDGVDKTRVSVMAFSGGAMVGVYVTARDERIQALVSCCCPVSITFAVDRENVIRFIENQRQISISRDMLPVQTPEEITKNFTQIDPLHCVDRISPRPLLIIHGDKDDLVDPAQAYQIYEKAKQPKELAMIAGAGHRLRIEEDAMQIAMAWLKKVSGLA